MQQLQTATTDAVSYRKNAQKILDSLKANDMELIEQTLAYSLEIFQSNEPPIRKLLMLRLIKDAIVIKSAKFINKYVQNRTLLTFIGNICTHKLGDSSYERGADLFQGQDPQSSCEFLRLALEMVEYLATTFPKDSKGAPTKFKIQFDELKQMGVKFYPQSELMNPFDPHVQIDQHQSQMNQPSQLKPAQSQVVNNRKERDETMLELNKMKQTLYQDIEMINDSLQNETDMGYINDVMETYSESMQVMEVNLAKQINKASAFEGVLSEDELAELYALKDFTAQFQKYYKGYLSELCTPEAYKKLKKQTLTHIQKIQNKDFDYSLAQQKQPKKQQQQQQFMSEEEQLEMIKQQSKIEYEQHQKSQISQQQSQSFLQKQKEEQQREDQRQFQQKLDQERIQREKEEEARQAKIREEEARQAKIREEQFRQEQLRQIQIREEYERQQREEQQRKEKERLEQERLELQRQEQLLEQQRKQAQQQVQQRSQTMKQNRNYNFQEQIDTPTGYESTLPNFQQIPQQSQVRQQQPQQNQKSTNNYIDSNFNNRQTSSFGKVKNDNQYEQIQSQFEQPPSEGFNQFNYQNNNQQDPMNRIYSSIKQIDNNFDENFDGLSQSTLTQQFFPLKMEEQIPIKEYTGKLVKYDNTQFQLLHKFRLSDSQQKRFKIASLKGKAALVNSPQLQVGVKQSLQYVPLKEKNYLKLTLYIGNKTQSPFDSCRVIFEGDNKSFQIWLKPDKIQERIEPGKQISQEIIGYFRQYENYKLINAVFQGQWANKQISVNFCIPTTLVSFIDFKDVSLQIFRAQWRGKKRQILKSETFLLNPKIVKTAYHIKKIFPKLTEFRPYQQFQHQQFEYFNDRQQQYITYKLGGIFELTNVNQNYLIKFIVLPNMYCTLQIIGTNEQLCKQMLSTLHWMLGLE